MALLSDPRLWHASACLSRLGREQHPSSGAMIPALAASQGVTLVTFPLVCCVFDDRSIKGRITSLALTALGTGSGVAGSVSPASPGHKASNRGPTPRRLPAHRTGSAAAPSAAQAALQPAQHRPSRYCRDGAACPSLTAFLPQHWARQLLEPVPPPLGSSCSLCLHRGCAHRRHGRPPPAARRLTTGKAASHGDARAAGTPGCGMARG